MEGNVVFGLVVGITSVLGGVLMFLNAESETRRMRHQRRDVLVPEWTVKVWTPEQGRSTGIGFILIGTAMFVISLAYGWPVH